MIMLAMLLQAAALPAAPAPEATGLGVAIARSGTFSRIAPVLIREQTEQLVRDTPGLSATEQAELRALAATTGAATVERITAAMGARYAAALSVADMRAIVTFNATDAAARYRVAEPAAIAAAGAAMGGFDFKAEVAKAFCAKTGKGCTARK